MSFQKSRVKDAPSSSDNIAPARRDGPVGTEQRLPQESDNTSVLDAKIDMKKKVDMKKNVGRSYGDMNVQMVFDPIGEIKGPAYYLMW